MYLSQNSTATKRYGFQKGRGRVYHRALELFRVSQNDILKAFDTIMSLGAWDFGPGAKYLRVSGDMFVNFPLDHAVFPHRPKCVKHENAFSRYL